MRTITNGIDSNIPRLLGKYISIYIYTHHWEDSYNNDIWDALLVVLLSKINCKPSPNLVNPLIKALGAGFVIVTIIYTYPIYFSQFLNQYT